MSSPESPAAKRSSGARALALLIHGESFLVPAVAVLVALGVGAILIAGQGVSPAEAYASLLHYAWFSSDGLTNTLLTTAVLTLTGLAVAIPLKAGLFNIGGLGQFTMGAVAGTWVAVTFSQLPGLLLIAFSMLAAIAGGAVWSWLSGILKATRNVHEVISTIMLNYVAAGLIDWLLNTYFRDPTMATPQTPQISPQAQIGAIGPIPITFVIAVALAVFSWWLMRSTVLGFKLTTAGESPEAARYAGVNLPRMFWLSMLIAGAFGGLAGGLQTLGQTYYFDPNFAGTLGFDGITVALLARTNPLACLPAAFLLASLRTGAPGLQFDLGVQQEIVDLLMAIILLLISIPVIGTFLRNRAAALGRDGLVAEVKA